MSNAIRWDSANSVMKSTSPIFTPCSVELEFQNYLDIWIFTPVYFDDWVVQPWIEPTLSKKFNHENLSLEILFHFPIGFNVIDIE